LENRERYGQDIVKLAQELERIRNSKLDVVAAQRDLKAVEVPEMGPNAVRIIGYAGPSGRTSNPVGPSGQPNVPLAVHNNSIQIKVGDKGTYPLNRLGTVQLANRIGLPIQYYDKMLAAGMTDLTATNVNAWLQKNYGEKRLVRIADGHIRAMLSDHYRILDNHDLVFQIMDRVKQHNAVVTDCALTESRMYVRATVPDYVTEVRKGDRVVPGVMVSNSEVGEGAFRVEAFLYRLVCQNGLIGTDKLYKVHIGGRMDIGEVGHTVYKDDTKRKMDEALWAQVRDIIDSTFDKNALNALIKQLREANEINLPKPEEALEVTVKELGLSDEKKNNLLKYFGREGDDNVFALVNSITRLAQDYPSYDERIHVERYAGEVLEQRIPTIKPRVVA
jgi:hypothetical protein